MEFLRNFYSVFPEYRTMDVRLLHLLTPSSIIPHWQLSVDLYCGREFRWPIHTLFL
jgi:hypothetical protein